MKTSDAEAPLPQVPYGAAAEINILQIQHRDAKEEALHAAFLMEGLHEAGYEACITSWGNGCIEMVGELVSYAPLIAKLCNAAGEAIDNNFPGVFDYEVTSPFGRWFGCHIIEHGEAPGKQEAEAWLIKDIEQFFSQLASPKEITAIKSAIVKITSK